MATVRLTDIYNPVPFAGLAARAQIELNKFIDSGVAVRSGFLQSLVSTGGNIGEITNMQPLGTPEPNYSTDDPDVSSTPNKISSEKQKYRLASQNQSWSTMDLAIELGLQDPTGAITSKIGQYWATVNERRIIQSCMGILADNVANDSSDMLTTVATDGAGAVADAERISPDVVLSAKQTMGDHGFQLTAIAMHSNIYTRLQRQNVIQFIPGSRSEIQIPTYLGYRVIVDDSLPAVAGSNRITYTCVMFGAGAIGMAEGPVETPSELDRKPDAGSGGGQTILHSRRSDLIHPFGFDFLSASVAGQSATLAELATASNWNRIWDRKQIPLSFIQVND
jgi:hypothetical protein